LKIPDASIDLFELDCKNAMIGHLRSIWIDESGHTLDDTTLNLLFGKMLSLIPNRYPCTGLHAEG
jgi:hypothetical protein